MSPLSESPSQSARSPRKLSAHPAAEMNAGDIDGVLASVAHGYHLAVHRDFPRNAFFTTAWQFVWGVGIAFNMWTTTAPAYLGTLGVSRTMLSMVMVLPWLFTPLQIFSSCRFGGRHRRGWLMASFMLATVPWLAYTAVVLTFPNGLSSRSMAACFVAASVCFTAGLACGIPLFFELLTDNTPLLRRGRLAGVRSAAIGIAGLCTGVMVRKVMRAWPEPQNYHVSFALGLSIWLVSCLLLLGVRDHVDPARLSPARRSRSVIAAFRATAGGFWTDINSRIYLFFHALLVAALALSPMMIDAAGRQLGADPTAKQTFTIVLLMCLIGPAWLLGLLADRYGYRIVAVLLATLVCSGYLLTLASSSLVVWYVAFGLCGLSSNLAATVLGNMCVELLPGREPSLLLSTATTMFLPIVLLGVLTAGRLGDSQGSYAFVFVLGAVMAAVAALGFLLLVAEPRGGRLYVVRFNSPP